MSKARELADVIGTQDTTENVLQGRRNLLINGDFQVWQRGTSGSTTNGYCSVDRWRTQNPSVASTLSKSAHRTLKFTYAGGHTTYEALAQIIENGTDYINGKDCTISFRAKSSTAKSMWIVFYYDGGVYTGLSHIPLTTSWDTYTINIPSSGFSVNEGGTVTPQFRFENSQGWATNDYVEFQEVQLELGSVATPFEHRSYGEELALCQRYYFEGWLRSAGRCEVSTDRTITSGQMPISFRASPTSSINTSTCTVDWNAANQTGATLSSFPVERSGSYNIVLYSWGVTPTDGDGCTVKHYVYADAEL